MKSRHFIPIIPLCLLFISVVNAQYFTKVSLDYIEKYSITVPRIETPKQFELYELEFEDIKKMMRNAINEFTLSLPVSKGDFVEFNCSSSSLLPLKLQEKYPNIRTFDGFARNEGYRVKMGFSPKGFHAMILRPGKSTVFIDAVSNESNALYFVYERSDYVRETGFDCFTSTEEFVEKEYQQKALAGDCQLRHYRLALACTGEYAVYHGGSKESVLAEFAVAMSRVNGIYERDLGITMSLIENTDEVIYLDGTTDPYTNQSGGTMLGENQQTLDQVIGTENYDIGHVFSTGGGGIAQLNSPCGMNSKARGVTGLSNPINDPFYVDYVSHEMGHQFGANHTQNNDCNRAGNTSMEVGSGNTIMGYAGICNPNSKNNSDDHFHAISIAEITSFILFGNGNNCSEILESENNPPVVSNIFQNYTIPGGTPFVLSVDATDEDDDQLSYCWEQMDNEVGNMPPQATNTQGPMFISNSPLFTPERYFPNLNAILNGTSETWEVLPTVSRSMSFRCTVRDNAEGIGCTDESNVSIEVVGTAGPFVLQSPNEKVEWSVSNVETISWDVAETNEEPIHCEMVDIYLSVDGGITYPITLAENVPNDGEHEITVPAVFTETARVMVRGDENVFFDVSDQNFCIQTNFAFNISQKNFELCSQDVTVTQVTSAGFQGFSGEINFSVPNLPDNISVNFQSNPLSIPSTTELIIGTVNADPGTYSFDIIGEADEIQVAEQITIHVYPSEIVQVDLQNPINGLQKNNLNANLQWAPAAGISLYHLQLSKSPAFDVLELEENNFAQNSRQVNGLDPNTIYYWRVKAINPCEETEYSETFAFQTKRDDICQVFESNQLPNEISSNSTDVITSNILVDENISFDYIKLFINVFHTWIGDLIIELEAPDGTILTIIDRPGVPESQFGCNADFMVFDIFDLAPITSFEVEMACPLEFDEIQSIDPLSLLNGINTQGEWLLRIRDEFNDDGGRLQELHLEFCNELSAEEIALKNETLIIPSGFNANISNNLLEIESQSNTTAALFTLRSIPSHGVLQLEDVDGNITVLDIGDQFSQSDIDEGRLNYIHDDSETMEDQFLFDAVDEVFNWKSNEAFNIVITQGDVFVLPIISQEILCAGDSTGILDFTVIDGNPPFDFSIDGGVNYQIESSFSNLPAGMYHLVVKDATNAFVYNNDTFQITEPTPLVSEANQVFYTINVEAMGGTSPYQYSLDGMNFSEENSFFDVLPGIYAPCVMDANGCISKDSIEINYLELNFEADASIIVCAGDSTGTISILAEGGFPDYTYSLTGMDYQMDNTFTGLLAGSYTVYVKDAGGKVVSQLVEVSENEGISSAVMAVDNELIIDAEGGNGTLSYSLDGINFQDSPIFSNVPTDNFSYYVLDESMCLIQVDVFILKSIQFKTDPSCFGFADGSINANGVDGFPPYQYSLNGGDFMDESNFGGLSAGEYTIQIRDTAGFLTESMILLTDPDAVTVSAEYVDGNIVITAMGGTGSYQYSIDGGENFQSENSFEVDVDGDYPIVVEDSNGCVDTNMFVLNVVPIIAWDEHNLRLYPVPFSDELSLETGGIEVNELRIMNLHGQEVSSAYEKRDGRYIVDTSHLVEGSYLCVVSSREGTYVKRLVKIR